MTTLPDALKEEAARKLISTTSLRLDDWQITDGYPEFVREGAAAFCLVQIDAQQTGRIDIKVTTPEGKALTDLWLELQDGKFKVHVYESVHDEPLTLICDDQFIAIDDHRPSS